MKKARVFLWIQSLLCVLLAALVIAGVVGVYLSGSESPAESHFAAVFTREDLAERLRAAAPVFYMLAILSAGGMIMGLKEEESPKISKTCKAENRAAGGTTVRLALLIAAFILIAGGILNGSARDVFSKAIMICAECIGLG